ncbi:hypothetical protein FGO68_gene9084 [Halteria grandinella]|uniref:Uncharacterized protein n=1 Tax=Halteria grandinella TaxID=5974 RepID=A0A8J8T8G9_HALGN|nr:hypothetical protein FGO68_gene9084 [Halteria grandinella]
MLVAQQTFIKTNTHQTALNPSPRIVLLKNKNKSAQNTLAKTIFMLLFKKPNLPSITFYFKKQFSHFP